MASSLPASKSGLYADPREDWLSLREEEILDPARPIVDPHHHLWDRGGQRYLIEELAADMASGSHRGGMRIPTSPACMPCARKGCCSIRPFARALPASHRSI